MAATDDFLIWVLTVGFSTVFTLNSGVVLREGKAMCWEAIHVFVGLCVTYIFSLWPGY